MAVAAPAVVGAAAAAVVAAAAAAVVVAAAVGVVVAAAVGAAAAVVVAPAAAGWLAGSEEDSLLSTLRHRSRPLAPARRSRVFPRKLLSVG